jgi:hypothetical protein
VWLCGVRRGSAIAVALTTPAGSRAGMSDLLLGLGLVMVGVGLFVWLKQWWSRRHFTNSPVTSQWLNDHNVHKDGHREK